MKGFDARTALAVKTQQAPVDERPHCPAHGCPCYPSIDIGGAGFMCSFHAAAKSTEQWPHVTQMLREHDWLRDFITTLMRDTKLVQDKAWRKFSAEFWQGADDYMIKPFSADTLDAIIAEMLVARTSERQGRLIDHDQAASMEKKKQEGYF